MNSHPSIQASLGEAAAILDAFRRDPVALHAMGAFVSAALRTLRAGGLLMACGNGGSLSQAMHFAEEWTGRFRGDRPALPAMAFSDPTQLSCIANDYGFEAVFSRQVEAHGRAGDLLLLLSTSGQSPNLTRAARVARARDVETVALLGRGGGKLASEVDIPILVPLATTSDRIQEVHLQILHSVLEAAERELFPESYEPNRD
jgi:D-sedoheptulose 7-phosphate isomerase